MLKDSNNNRFFQGFFDLKIYLVVRLSNNNRFVCGIPLK